MPALATEKDLFLDHFAQYDNRWADAPFARLRHAARNRFRDLRLPGSKTEDWRFTNVAGLWKIPFEPALDEIPAGGQGPSLTLPARIAEDAVRLVFVNGHFAASLSKAASDLPLGIHVGNLLGGLTDRAERFLGKFAEPRNQLVPALNTGLFHDGAFVWIADGHVLDRPIEIVHLAAPQESPLAVHPRVLIVLGKNSQATVLERYQSARRASGRKPDVVSGRKPDVDYLTNAVTEIVVGDRAIVDHYKLQEESPEAYHLASTQVVLEAHSQFTTHYLGWGGKLVRNEVRVRFDAENGEATVNGLYVAKDHQHTDNFTVIDHAKPHCTSHELYKGILAGHSQGVFNGKICVRPDAQKTDAKQTNKVLLLSQTAAIHTKPQLEIFADDVKCTHGAAVGQLDDDQIFYLRSRGLNLDEARRLLTFAFANDVVGRVKIDAIRERLQELLIEEVS